MHEQTISARRILAVAACALALCLAPILLDAPQAHAASGTVGSIGVSGLAMPQGGKRVSYATKGLSGRGYQVVAQQWLEVGARRQASNSSSINQLASSSGYGTIGKFSKGRSYALVLYVAPRSGGTLPSQAKDLKFTVNGYRAQGIASDVGAIGSAYPQVSAVYMLAFGVGSDLTVVPLGKKSVALVATSKRGTRLALAESVRVGTERLKISQIGPGALKGLKTCTAFRTNTCLVKMSSGAFRGSKVRSLYLRTKKLSKSGVRNCLRGSKVKRVYVPKSKYRAYKKLFKKRVCGKSVRVLVG